MTFKLNEYHEDRCTLEPKLYKVYDISGETIKDVCKSAYPYQRTLRYCNGWYVKFADANMQRAFLDWQANDMTIEDYYGGGVVD